MAVTNFRNVLKVFGLMRNFSPDDEALLNTLRGLGDADREQLIELLGPVKKPTKKPASKGAGKSRRAASLGQQMNKALRLPVDDSGNHGDGLCVVGVDSKGETCGEPADANVHHLSTHPDYHEFKAWEVTAIAPAHTAKDDNYEKQVGAVVGGN